VYRAFRKPAKSVLARGYPSGMCGTVKQRSAREDKMPVASVVPYRYALSAFATVYWHDMPAGSCVFHILFTLRAVL
jgi:hypothetical protein